MKLFLKSHWALRILSKFQNDGQSQTDQVPDFYVNNLPCCYTGWGMAGKKGEPIYQRKVYGLRNTETHKVRRTNAEVSCCALGIFLARQPTSGSCRGCRSGSLILSLWAHNTHPPDAPNAACCWLAAESLLRHCHWPNKMLHLRLHPLLEGRLLPGTRQYLQYTSLVPWTSQKGQPTRPPTCKSPPQSLFQPFFSKAIDTIHESPVFHTFPRVLILNFGNIR